MAARIPWRLRLKVILGGLGAVFVYPSYLLIAFAGMVLALGTALWALNIDLLKFVLLESGVDAAMKFEFFFGVYQSLFNEIDSWQSLVLVVFGLSFGVNVALLVYVLRRRFIQQKSLKGGSASLSGLVLATIGGGCAACGTSLLSPLFASAGITSVTFVRDFGLAAAIAGIALITYSIIKLSEQAASLRGTQ